MLKSATPETQVQEATSFASLGPLFYIEIYLIDVGTEITPPHCRCGLVGIDNFTNKAWACPLIHKTREMLIGGAIYRIKNVGNPEQVYIGQEGGFHPP